MAHWTNHNAVELSANRFICYKNCLKISADEAGLEFDRNMKCVDRTNEPKTCVLRGRATPAEVCPELPSCLDSFCGRPHETSSKPTRKRTLLDVGYLAEYYSGPAGQTKSYAVN
jgi:hypothetical protein